MIENDQQQQQVHHVASEETNRLYNLQQDQEIVDLKEKLCQFRRVITNRFVFTSFTKFFSNG
jgi:hypothetical protein